jgi:hypothetical protein
MDVIEARALTEPYRDEHVIISAVDGWIAHLIKLINIYGFTVLHLTVIGQLLSWIWMLLNWII